MQEILVGLPRRLPEMAKILTASPVGRGTGDPPGSVRLDQREAFGPTASSCWPMGSLESTD
jgi:hypothetical protein